MTLYGRNFYGLHMGFSCIIKCIPWFALLLLGSCRNQDKDKQWQSPTHSADRLKPWHGAEDSLSWAALRWIQALDRGDTLALKKVMADTIWVGEDSTVGRTSVLGPLFYRFRSGYQQQTECLALLPTLSLEDSVYRVMGYLRQRFHDGQVGSSMRWKYRRLAVLWEIKASKIVGWRVWEQDWPGSHHTEDSLRSSLWPRWGIRCSNAPDSLRILILDWEKRLMANYVRDAYTFWKDTASARSDDGWVWTGPPVTMARFMAKECEPYRDLDTVIRELKNVEVLRLGMDGQYLGLVFGTEKCFRNEVSESRVVHRLYFLRDGKIDFAEQYRNSSLMP